MKFLIIFFLFVGSLKAQVEQIHVAGEKILADIINQAVAPLKYKNVEIDTGKNGFLENLYIENALKIPVLCLIMVF